MAERHPVADLLTDEMRERVRAARFERVGGCVTEEGSMRCPMAVALDLPNSFKRPILAALASTDAAELATRRFMDWSDSADSRPADVYALLGCEPADGAS